MTVIITKPKVSEKQAPFYEKEKYRIINGGELVTLPSRIIDINSSQQFQSEIYNRIGFGDLQDDGEGNYIAELPVGWRMFVANDSSKDIYCQNDKGVLCFDTNLVPDAVDGVEIAASVANFYRRFSIGTCCHGTEEGRWGMLVTISEAYNYRYDLLTIDIPVLEKNDDDISNLIAMVRNAYDNELPKNVDHWGADVSSGISHLLVNINKIVDEFVSQYKGSLDIQINNTSPDLEGVSFQAAGEYHNLPHIKYT